MHCFEMPKLVDIIEVVVQEKDEKHAIIFRDSVDDCFYDRCFGAIEQE